MPRAAQLYQICRQQTEIFQELNIYNCVRARGQDSLNEGNTFGIIWPLKWRLLQTNYKC